MEKTYVMLKPDCIKRGLIGKLISRIEDKGLKITNMKMTKLNKEILTEHYKHHAEKPFFKEILDYMMSDYVIAMIVEGEEAILKVKMLVGPTRWYDKSAPGTIRGDYATSVTENLIHCTDPDDPEGTAEEEIKRFFN